MIGRDVLKRYTRRYFLRSVPRTPASVGRDDRLTTGEDNPFPFTVGSIAVGAPLVQGCGPAGDRSQANTPGVIRIERCRRKHRSRRVMLIHSRRSGCARTRRIVGCLRDLSRLQSPRMILTRRRFLRSHVVLLLAPRATYGSAAASRTQLLIGTGRVDRVRARESILLTGVHPLGTWELSGLRLRSKAELFWHRLPRAARPQCVVFTVASRACTKLLRSTISAVPGELHGVEPAV